MKPKPILQALLLADRIYKDVSGKHVIAGTFNKWMFIPKGKVPETRVVDGEDRRVIPGGMQAGSPSVYVSLTNIHGTVPLTLRYVDLKTDEVFFHMDFQIKCQDPLLTAEIVLPMPSLPAVAGVHALELLSDNEPIGSHRVHVEELREQGNDHDSNDD